MGRRGFQPQPTVLKLLKGNPGKRRLNDREPILDPPEDSTPPVDLDGEGLAEWQRLYEQLVAKGVLTCGDLTTFHEYCFVKMELNRFKRAARKCSADEAIRKGLIKATVTLRQQLRQLAGDLGLTPASRSGVKASGEQKKETKLEKYLRPVS